MCLDNIGVNICYLFLIVYKFFCCSSFFKSFISILYGFDMLVVERLSLVFFLLSKVFVEIIFYKMKFVSVCVYICFF